MSRARSWRRWSPPAVLGLLFLIALTVAIKDIPAVSASGSPVAAIIRSQLGPVAERILLAGLVFAMFGAGMVVMAACSRQVFAMARDKRFPAHELMRKVNPQDPDPGPGDDPDPRRGRRPDARAAR